MSKPITETKRKDSDGLTLKQRRFVDALIENGGNKRQAAYVALGLDPRDKSKLNHCSVYGSRTAKLPQVRKRLLLHAEQIIADAAPQAAEAIRKLLRHTSGYVRLTAAQDVLNRNRIGTPQQGQQSLGGVSVNISLYAPQEQRNDLRSHEGGWVIEPERPGGSKTRSLSLDPLPLT